MGAKPTWSYAEHAAITLAVAGMEEWVVKLVLIALPLMTCMI